MMSFIYEAMSGTIPKEYQVKAAYLYQFLKYVEWPDHESQIRIYVINGSPMYPALRPIEGQIIGGRKIVVQHIDQIGDFPAAHILFVSADVQNMKAILSKNIHGLLVVGEEEDFIQNGGMIRFYLEKDNVRFEINAAALEKAGIKMDSKLLRLGRKH
jgi:hypothetical protein